MALIIVPATVRSTDLTGFQDLSGLWPGSTDLTGLQDLSGLWPER